VPIEFVIEPELGLVRTTLVGRITLPDMACYVRVLVTARLLGSPQLLDARAAVLQLTPDEVREFADLMESLRTVCGKAPVAFVTADAGSYRVAQHYWDLGAGSNPTYQVFEDLAAAETWLMISR